MTQSVTDPLVSVIIPVFNGEPYLREAIESVLGQTYTNTEIILVDDGSTDGTAELVKHSFPSVQYFYQDNAGTGAARNRGLKETHGDYIAFIDADDHWIKNKLSLQMKILQEQANVDMVFGHVKQFHSPELDADARSRLRCPEGLMAGELPSTMLCRRQVFDRVGGFETHWKVGQDVSWILRAKESNICFVMLPDLVYMRRLHKTNKGVVHRDAVGDRVRILRAHLDRKRAGKTGATEDDS